VDIYYFQTSNDSLVSFGWGGLGCDISFVGSAMNPIVITVVLEIGGTQKERANKWNTSKLGKLTVKGN
jgi:hypothetical protein